MGAAYLVCRRRCWHNRVLEAYKEASLAAFPFIRGLGFDNRLGDCSLCFFLSDLAPGEKEENCRTNSSDAKRNEFIGNADTLR